MKAVIQQGTYSKARPPNRKCGAGWPPYRRWAIYPPTEERRMKGLRLGFPAEQGGLVSFRAWATRPLPFQAWVADRGSLLFRWCHPHLYCCLGLAAWQTTAPG